MYVVHICALVGALIKYRSCILSFSLFVRQTAVEGVGLYALHNLLSLCHIRLLRSNFYPSFLTSFPILRIEHDVIVRLKFLVRQRISSYTRQASLAKDQHIERPVSLQDNTRGLLFVIQLCDSRS